jgi:hypothetical protein
MMYSVFDKICVPEALIMTSHDKSIYEADINSGSLDILDD